MVERKDGNEIFIHDLVLDSFCVCSGELLSSVVVYAYQGA